MFMNAQFAASNTNHKKGTEATVFQPFWSLLFLELFCYSPFYVNFKASLSGFFKH